MTNISVFNILEQLIACQSVTPNDDKCQIIIADYLSKLGFEIKHIKHDDVVNLIAKYGTGKPTLAFVGHTDVVPVGDINEWESNPFKLSKVDNKLFGRGTSEMKGSIAAMMFAVQSFILNNKDFTFLLC